MLKDKLNFITEEEYRGLNALSYSFIKDFITVGPEVIINGIEKKESFGLSFGSLVDKIITEENYDYSKDYVISQYSLDLNGDDAVSIILRFLKENPEYPIDNDSMLKLSYELDLWTRIKDNEKRLARIFCDKFNDQYQLLKEINNGKQVISESDFKTALEIVDTLKNHPFTKDIFDTEFEILYQVPILYEINGVKFKSLLDILVIDHKNKICYPIDLKTGEDKSFMRNFNQYKYEIQGALYSYALIELLKQLKLDDYKVEEFKFIYMSRKKPNRPNIFSMDKEYIKDILYGYTDKYKNYVKGIFEIIDDYIWHIKNDIYFTTRDLYESNGVIILKNINKYEE